MMPGDIGKFGPEGEKAFYWVVEFVGLLGLLGHSLVIELLGY